MTVHEAVGVVIAEDEDALDLSSARRPVAGEYPKPDFCNGLQLAHETGVCEVARDDDGVCTPVAECFQRLLERLDAKTWHERLAVVGKPRVDVADDAETQMRRVHCDYRTTRTKASGGPMRRRPAPVRTAGSVVAL